MIFVFIPTPPALLERGVTAMKQPGQWNLLFSTPRDVTNTRSPIRYTEEAPSTSQNPKPETLNAHPKP